MKKIISFVLFVFIMGCSDSDSTQNGDIGQGGSLAVFAIKGNYLYGVDQMKLNVFSLINPEKPVKVNEITIGFDIETLFSYGDNLFIGSRNGMFIYSITNPENPTKLSSVQHFTACDPVIANSTHSYVTLNSNATCGNNTNVLQVYDTKDLTNPKLIHSRTLSQPKGISFYTADYLLVCDDVIKIFNIQNPVEPVLVHAIDKNCFDLIIRDNTLFAIGNKGVYRYKLNPNDIKDIQLESETTF
ncbi:LVIVD repeat-containing protein [Flavobacterium glaciei]|uniref:LVIVD repeat-containing protein n=1 Tax=Flavobacterium glaciei TaxID=386300 RepID=A0A562Q2L6_9FLAO|nr:hypothetical protein [Flavobacterium glaciei]RDI57624.1 hypothetical protein DFR66_102247 [Flavobacterium glaciei]TWI50576.1 hypothetical protein IQ02_00471 [Flavobacterium glaciei]